MPPHAAWAWLLCTDASLIREALQQARAGQGGARFPLLAIVQLVEAFRDVTSNVVAQEVAATTAAAAAWAPTDNDTFTCVDLADLLEKREEAAGVYASYTPSYFLLTVVTLFPLCASRTP